MAPVVPTEEPPDDFGIVDTNLPTVKMLWERRGHVMHLTTVTEPAPPYLPPWERPAPE